MDRVNGITWISLFGLVVVGICGVINPNQETLNGFFIIFYILLVSLSVDIYNLIKFRRNIKSKRTGGKK